jgi:hypothetical protein
MEDDEESAQELNGDLSSTEEPEVTSRQLNVNSTVPTSSAASSSSSFPSSSSSGSAICSFEQYKISPTNFRNMNNDLQPLQYPWGSILGTGGVNPLFQSPPQKKSGGFDNSLYQTPPSNLKDGDYYASPQYYKSDGTGGLNYDKIDGKMIGSDRKRNRKAMLYDDNTLDDIMGQSELFPFPFFPFLICSSFFFRVSFLLSLVFSFSSL